MILWPEWEIFINFNKISRRKLLEMTEKYTISSAKCNCDIACSSKWHETDQRYKGYHKQSSQRTRNHSISVWSVWSVVENYLLQAEKKRPRTTRKWGAVKSGTRLFFVCPVVGKPKYRKKTSRNKAGWPMSENYFFRWCSMLFKTFSIGQIALDQIEHFLTNRPAFWSG